MEKINVTKLIEFSRKDKEKREGWVKRTIQKKQTRGSGDWWGSAISAMKNQFMKNDNSIKDKINELLDFKQNPQKQQNTELLQYFPNVEYLKQNRPSDNLREYINQDQYVTLTINKLNVFINRNYLRIFSWEDDKGNKEVGAIFFNPYQGKKFTFSSSKNLYDEVELGMFSEFIYKSLQVNFKDKIINPQYCMVVDARRKMAVRHQQILDGQIDCVLESVIKDFNSLLSNIGYKLENGQVVPKRA